MPRGRLTKVDILSRVFKIKNTLHNTSSTEEYKRGANDYLNQVLDIINEYSQ